MLQETVPVPQEEDLFTHSCPSIETLFPNNPSFAKTIRDSYKYLTGVGRAFHPLPVRFVHSQGAFDFGVKNTPLAMITLSFNLGVFVLYREIELPLHDNGMEPVEFLKSMGISLTPLNEVTAGDVRSQRVFYLLFTHLVT